MQILLDGNKSVIVEVIFFKGLTNEGQRRFTVVIDQVNVCTVADEKSYDGLTPLTSCEHKGSIARGASEVHGRACL